MNSLLRERISCRDFTVLVLSLFIVISFGCSRAHYRSEADHEVIDLVRRAAREIPTVEPDASQANFNIEVDPRSRMFDPSCRDHPPMPPDDPLSHQLMHCVDCKQGSPCWHKYGEARLAENPNWLAYLPRDKEDRVILDLKDSVHMARRHSRDYQNELEELYLTALGVTAERFRFDTQFFGGHSTFFTADGPSRSGGSGSASSTLDLSTHPSGTDLQMSKLFATGGELVVGLANSLIWEFSGSNTQSATTLLDFSLVQPLLRAGGRAVVLESLTLSERSLLANVREMERFHRSFYADIVTGRSAEGGGLTGSQGLTGNPGGGAGASGTGGYLGLLQQLQRIRNRESNVKGLKSSLARLEALGEADRIDQLQIDQARQALFNAQSRLLSSKTLYEQSLDNFKIKLGLPPNLNIKIEDSFLAQFELIDPALTNIQLTLDQLLDSLRNLDQPADQEALQQMVQGIQTVRSQTIKHLNVVREDFSKLDANLPERRKSLRRLAEREEIESIGVGRSAFDIAQLDHRVEQHHKDFSRLAQRFKTTWSELDNLQAGFNDLTFLAARQQLIRIGTALSEELLELTLAQARARLDIVVLAPTKLKAEEALEIARQSRRDWKNARATLVDRWRQIEITSNDLESNLDLVFSGDISNIGNNPLRLRGSTGRLRVGVEFDAPLTRLTQRNAYREALIEYQRARRNYYKFEDRVSQSLRNTIRTIDLDQINFELRREGVHVAIRQVDLARLRLNEPPRPGARPSLGSTITRDLVSALSALLDAQNDFLSIWVNHEIQRISLDLDLGTMQLDPSGIWIDPGSFGQSGQNQAENDASKPAQRNPPNPTN